MFHHGDRFNDYMCIGVLSLMTNYFGDGFIGSLSTDVFIVVTGLLAVCPLTCSLW